VPREVLERMSESFRDTVLVSRVYAQFLRDLLDVLRGRGIDAVVMKGITLADWLYADIAARPQSRGAEEAPAADLRTKIEVDRLSFYYGGRRALEDISIRIPPNLVTAFIGPSGCGKSTFLRAFNRMNDIISGTRVEGRILVDNADIYAPDLDVVEREVGGQGQDSPGSNTLINASCGISTVPMRFMRSLPFFCFSKSLRLRVTSPP